MFHPAVNNIILTNPKFLYSDKFVIFIYIDFNKLIFYATFLQGFIWISNLSFNVTTSI